MEIARIRTTHKNIDHGFASPFMLAYLAAPLDVSVAENRISLELDLPLLGNAFKQRHEQVDIFYKQITRPGSDKWMLLVNGFASSTKLWDYQQAYFCLLYTSRCV